MQRLKNLWPQRSGQDLLRRQGVQSLRSATPLFECKPPLSARWTWPLVTAQLIICAVGGELILNQWTRRVEPKEASKSQPETKPETPVKPEYELRPLWQRIGMMGAQIAATATFCMVLFRARSRTIHKLYVLPSEVVANASLAKKHKRALVLQNVWQFSGQGKVLPFAGTLERGTHDGEVILSTPEEGSYILPLENVKINGKPYDSAHSVKETLFKEWYGPKKGSVELTRHGWVD